MAIYHKKGKRLCFGLERKDICHIEARGRSSGYFKEISAVASYMCAFLLNKESKYTLIYGADSFLGFKPEDNLMYKEAVKKAFGGKRVSYEYFLNGDKNFVYQTNLLPLSREDGAVNNVLGIVKVFYAVCAPGCGLAVAEFPEQSFMRRVINAKEEEKRKISSALHDEIGTAAVVINSLLGILKEDIKEGKKAAALKSAGEVSCAFEELLSRIKKVIVDTRPPQIGEIGLNLAVKNLIDTLSPAPLKIHYGYKVKDSVKMPEAVKITLYRVVQEALSNTLKHARAGNIWIKFSEDAGTIYLTVKDDGIGYPGGKERAVDKLGIRGMKENLSYIGGKIKISGSKGKGTTTIVECPKITYVR